MPENAFPERGLKLTPLEFRELLNIMVRSSTSEVQASTKKSGIH
jgi:hypothetical protein